MNKIKIEIDNKKISVYSKKILSKDYILKHEFYREEISNIGFFSKPMHTISGTHTDTILICSIKKEQTPGNQFVITPQYAEEIFRELKNYKYNISNEKEMGKIIEEAKHIKKDEKIYFKMTIFMIFAIILLGILIPLFILLKK